MRCELQRPQSIARSASSSDVCAKSGRLVEAHFLAVTWGTGKPGAALFKAKSSRRELRVTNAPALGKLGGGAKQPRGPRPGPTLAFGRTPQRGEIEHPTIAPPYRAKKPPAYAH